MNREGTFSKLLAGMFVQDIVKYYIYVSANYNFVNTDFLLVFLI